MKIAPDAFMMIRVNGHSIAFRQRLASVTGMLLTGYAAGALLMGIYLVAHNATARAGDAAIAALVAGVGAYFCRQALIAYEGMKYAVKELTLLKIENWERNGLPPDAIERDGVVEINERVKVGGHD